jgi:TP901 family phage tail tape measure protein
MSLENVGIGGVLTFDGAQAIIGMGIAEGASNRFARAQVALAAHTARVGRAFTGLGIAAAPLTAILGFAGQYAAKFEQQMSAVKAVSQGTEKDMAALTMAAKRFGATTVFDPVEIGKAEQELAVAGFNAKETLAALPGVLAAAAAEGMGLSKAVEIVATTLRGMGLAADQSGRVADVLAMASAKTSSTISSLGTSMSYASGRAKVMGIDLETTTSLVGLLSDAGLKGARAGTSLNAMLEKLSRPNKAAAAYLKAHNIQMKKTADGGFDVIATVKDIAKAVSKEGDAMKRSADIANIFGERGARAFSALSSGIASGKIDTLVEDLRKAHGAAERMASTRLEGFIGGLKKIGNAGKALAIELFGGIIGSFGPGINEIAKNFGNIVAIVQELNAATDVSRAEFEIRYGPIVTAIAYGIKDAINSIRGAIDSVTTTIGRFAEAVTGQTSPEVIQSITKWVVILGTVAGAVAPIMIAFGGFVTFIGSVVLPALTSLGLAMGPIGWAATAAAVIVGVAFAKIKMEGVSTGDVLVKVAEEVGKAWEGVDWWLTWIGRKFDRLVDQAVTFSNKLQLAFMDLQALMNPAESGKITGSAEYQATKLKANREIKYAWEAPGYDDKLKAEKKFNKDMQQWRGQLGESLRGSSGTIDELTSLLDTGALRNKTQARQVETLLANAKTMKEEAIKLGASEDKTEQDRAAQLATDLSNELSKAKKFITNPNVNVGVNLNDQRKLDIHNCMQVDGKELAVATGRHKQEIQERAGFRTTPWQRRQIVEQGAAPGGLGGGNL